MPQKHILIKCYKMLYISYERNNLA
jgi:hypothetical protein